MMKPVIAATFGIALALGGAYGAFGHFGNDRAPAVVASVSVAPMASGQNSQAKLAPLDPTIGDSLLAARQQLEANLQSAKALPSSADASAAVNTGVQNFVNQVQQAVQNNTQSQIQTSANATANGGTNSTSTTVTSNNGVTTTTTTVNGVTTSSTTSTPSSASSAAAIGAANEALGKAIDAYNQAVAKVGALDLPPDIKQALMDYLNALRTQLLSISIPDQLNAAQAAAMTNSPAVDALNAFLANVNTLNMTNDDKAKAFAALLSAFGAVPGVNPNFTFTPGTSQATAQTSRLLPALPAMPELAALNSTQIQSAIDQAMANLTAQQQKLFTQSTAANPLANVQLFGLNSPFQSTNALRSITGLTQPH